MQFGNVSKRKSLLSENALLYNPDLSIGYIQILCRHCWRLHPGMQGCRCSSSSSSSSMQQMISNPFISQTSFSSRQVDSSLPLHSTLSPFSSASIITSELGLRHCKLHLAPHYVTYPYTNQTRPIVVAHERGCNLPEYLAWLMRGVAPFVGFFLQSKHLIFICKVEAFIHLPLKNAPN